MALIRLLITRFDGVMVRGSAMNLEGGWFEPWPSHNKDIKKIITASLVDAQHLKRISHGQTRGWQTLCRLDG